MQSDRLIINNYDQSTAINVDTDSGVLGFTLVDAPSGPATPILISNTSELRSIFGKSSSMYPELYEVEQFIGGGYKCYVGNSRVSTESVNPSTVPCILVTDEGYILTTVKYTGSDSTSLTKPEIVDDGLSAGYTEDTVSKKLVETKATCLRYMPVYLTTLDEASEVTQDDGSTKVPATQVLTFDVEYNSTTSKQIILYQRTSLGNISVTSTTKNTPVVSTTLGGLGVIENVLDTYEINKLSDSDLSNMSFYTPCDTPTNIIAYILPKYPSDYPNTIFNIDVATSKLDLDEASDVNKRDVLYISCSSITDSGSSINSVNSVLGTIGNETSFKGFDESNTDYMSQNGFMVYVDTEKSFTNNIRPIEKYTTNIITGPSKISEASNKNWSQFADDSIYDNVDLYFDPGYHEDNYAGDNNKYKVSTFTSSGFTGLSKTRELAGFIFNQTMPTSAIAKIESATPLTYGSRYWNICGKVRVNNGSEYIYSSFVGARALLQAQIIEDYNGGQAPMFTTGNLSMSVLASNLTYRYTKSELTTLDSANYNPVVYDSNYGLMVTSQKTCKGGATTDWSYIGHVSAFLNFEKEVYNTVMIPQLGKPNNPYYRELRKQQVEHLLEERLVTNRIWSEGIVDTSTNEGVNDDFNRKARKFVIVVKVKVDIFSEYVVLNFFNVDQSTSLSSEA